MHRRVWHNHSSFITINSIHLSQSIWAECKTKHQKCSLYLRMYLNHAWLLLSLSTCFTQAVFWETVEKIRKLLNALEAEGVFSKIFPIVPYSLIDNIFHKGNSLFSLKLTIQSNSHRIYFILFLSSITFCCYSLIYGK